MAGLQIVFMGTPDLACVSLEALLQHADMQVMAVVTQPDRPKGRDLKLTAPPVKILASQHGLPVLQPERARDAQFLETLRKLHPDLIAVAAFGQILPQTILDLPKFGCLNVHTSLLPRYRGAGPIQRAILNGDAETGVTIMKMDAGLDTGDILSQEPTVITEEDNAQTLHDRLAVMGAELLTQTIPDYVEGRIRPRPQPVEGVVHAPKISREDGQIDWSRSARSIWNQVRALVPWPGAFTFFPSGSENQLLKIWEARSASGTGSPGSVLQADKSGLLVACGEDALRILTVQKAGGKRMTAGEFAAGYVLQVGQTLLSRRG